MVVVVVVRGGSPAPACPDPHTRGGVAASPGEGQSKGRPFEFLRKRLLQKIIKNDRPHLLLGCMDGMLLFVMVVVGLILWNCF